MKIILKGIALLLLLGLGAATYLYFTINDYQRDGELQLSVLDAPVTVHRDALAIPYIEAQSLADGLRAQGFITGQDRLFQTQLYRLLAQGRLSEVFGERGIKNDTLIRLININGMAERQTAALDQQARDYYQHYVDGLNAYITGQQHEHPLAVRLMGIKPEPWTLQDIVAVQLFQTWSNGSNWRIDLLSQQLIDAVGPERAQQIAQVSVNPDDNSVVSAQLAGTVINPLPGDQTPEAEAESSSAEGASSARPETLILHADPEWLALLPSALAAGSNAWATGSRKSSGGKPIFANNPHLPVTTVPGFWHPIGIFTPELTAVGVAAPGSPGIGVGRTQDIAYGATVGGSDGADLYIEQLDSSQANHYLQGGVAYPLTLREEVIRIKDRSAASGFREQQLRIRSTPRGPLISDHGISVGGERAIALRWAVADVATPSLGSDRLLIAQNLQQARDALKFSPTALSYIVVDHEGGIARISTGRVPVRKLGDGSKPLRVSTLDAVDYDNWQGLIAPDDMPVEINPDKDWVGTANHRVVQAGYPYQFSKIFASAWRYRRIKQVMEASDTMSIDDHWRLINDIYNPMAAILVPLFVQSLQQANEPQLAAVLRDWDHVDQHDAVAPALFQMLHKHLVINTFEDELPEPMWPTFLDAVYFWQERLILMLQQPQHSWFDKADTEQREQRDDILALSVTGALTELEQRLGNNPEQWQWGKLHTITFASPVIPGKTAARWLGGSTHPMFGSGETLNRAAFKLSKGFDAEMIDSVRLVADLADDEKILAVIPGGTSARYFDPSLTNQTADWLAGRANPIWFDVNKARQQAQSSLILRPE
ncbi:MAG: penicillin acylase family protein [Gammaproteobacteria bacterium]|nr:penicillin acylase family protein [Gammaproteobacteria bacterium]